MDNSAKTARVRTRLSGPMAYLHSQGLIVGKALDYGCGRGGDAILLSMEMFDPFWHPYYFNLSSRYDTVTCNYVLDTIPYGYERELVVKRIRELLKPGGKAYISVQRNIFLEKLVLLKSTKHFRIYVL